MKSPVHPCQHRFWNRLLAALIVLSALTGCGSLPQTRESPPVAERAPASAETTQKANDVVLYALGLIDTGYRFGGKNPAAGFDCSGMVSYIYTQAARLEISGSATDIARRSTPVDLQQLRPGDLVFFNTRHNPCSHVGIYIGDDRFVHAPSESGLARIRTDSLTNRYFATRLEAARSLLD